jgi:hypothetical protein
VLVAADNPATAATGDPLYDNLRYTRIQAYLGLRLFW